MGGSWCKLSGGIGLGLLKMMKKATTTKALIIKINLIFLVFFLIAYASLLVWPFPTSYEQQNVAAPLARCSVHDCHRKVRWRTDPVLKMKAVLEETTPTLTMKRVAKPRFMDEIIMNSVRIGGTTVGMVNMEADLIGEYWRSNGETIVDVRFDKVSVLFEWKHLFPEWIDEEQDTEGGYRCPEIPMPEELDMDSYPSMDLIVARLPCRRPSPGWARDMLRLQVHLVTANLMAKKGKRDWFGKIKVVLWSECRPMMDLFRCDDLEKREGDWWYFEVDAARIEQKVALPVGSCNLALPLWGQEVNEVYDLSKITSSSTTTPRPRREAYATVLHSSDSYVCGAIALAQSLLLTNTSRDLVLLLDKSIPTAHRAALSAAGWKIRIIKRIRNPRAQRGSYNEYNYSKFRLWQLTEYDKVVFIDADVVVLRNLDLLFHFPQLSAAGNDASIFNSGVMVLEPSNCTFRILMEHRREIVSYNGGDQGFLNEVFVWWHRLPRRVNFLKNFWSNSTIESGLKNQLFGSDPPKLYSIHYLGLKPWTCYRDYDCNWDLQEQHVYASDVAHRRWWKMFDSMDKALQPYCGLSRIRRDELERDRKTAQKLGINGSRWRINITDPRRFMLSN